MYPFPRPFRSPWRLRGSILALLISAGLVLPPAQAARETPPAPTAPAKAKAAKTTKSATPPPTKTAGTQPRKARSSTKTLKTAQAAKTAKTPKASKASAPAKDARRSKATGATQPGGASSVAMVAATAPAAALAPAVNAEAADIDDLRARLAARTLLLMRRVQVDDVSIEVWSHTMPRRFYVAVLQQGEVRRTLVSSDEAEAWQRFDSFRRIAAAGEVGRPVLLGRMADATDAALPEPLLPAVPLTPISDGPDLRFFGSAVETLRRQRFGDEVVRLVWSPETREYFAALTRHSTVVMMLRSRDADDATRAYDNFLRQAEARAALLPAASSSASASPVAATATATATTTTTTTATTSAAAAAAASSPASAAAR